MEIPNILDIADLALCIMPLVPIQYLAQGYMYRLRK
jgi:hypothetical protein